MIAWWEIQLLMEDPAKKWLELAGKLEQQNCFALPSEKDLSFRQVPNNHGSKLPKKDKVASWWTKRVYLRCLFVERFTSDNCRFTWCSTVLTCLDRPPGVVKTLAKFLTFPRWQLELRQGTDWENWPSIGATLPNFSVGWGHLILFLYRCLFCSFCSVGEVRIRICLFIHLFIY